MPGILRIALIDSWRSESFDGSGTAVGIRNLAQGLAVLGHEVSLVRPRGGRPGLVYRLLFNLRVPARLRASGPFSVVVGFDIDGFRWAKVRRPSDGPYVVSLKGIAADEARFSRSRRERALLSTLGHIEGRNSRRADRVLVPSAYSADVAARAYGIPANRIAVIPEAVDLAPWRAVRATRETARGRRAERAPSAPPSITILSVARQYPRKDTGTLLRAMPSVRARHPGVRLRVIGGGPELGRLEGLAKELGLEESVEFRGAVPSDADVRAAFQDADIFCLPSLQEGFGIAFVEAMAAGLPVVAARAGAVPEVVQDGVTGILVPPGEPAGLGAALNRLLDDEETRVRMGNQGAKRAERFDLATVARQFVEELSSRRES